MIVAYLASHAATVIGAILSFLLLGNGGGPRRTSQGTLAWILGFVFLPFLALPLFLLIGRRKFPSVAKGPDAETARRNAAEWTDAEAQSIAGVLRPSGVAPPRPGCSFELLTTGEAAYARLMDLVAGAKRTIDLTMFILGDDATGHAVVDALAERASQGVTVRLILDGVGSSLSHRRAAAILGKVGAEVRIFMPLLHSPIRGRTNLRSHRKLAVFDGRHVFAGGMNLATEYMGPTPIAGRWRDVAAVASGPIAADAEGMFESDWVFCGGVRRPPPTASTLPIPSHGDELVQVVPSGPDLVTDTFYDLFLVGIFAARERVALVTPYYVPDDVLQHALVITARRGVCVDVVVPSVSNHHVADVARRILLRELEASGVHVRYYPHGMVHAKAMVIDDSFAYVGSPNFDMRSLFLNYENALCVFSPAAIGQVRDFVEGLVAQCESQGPVSRARPILEQVARFLAPEL